MVVLKNYYLFPILSFLLFFCSGCTPLTAEYDAIAYDRATSIKVDALDLMAKAQTPYVDNIDAIEAIETRIDKAYEYAKGRPRNQIITKQWQIIRDRQRNSLGGFLQRWQEKKTLSRMFIREAHLLVEKGFDQIIGLESGLINPDELVNTETE